MLQKTLNSTFAWNRSYMAEKDISTVIVGILILITVLIGATATWLTLKGRTSVPKETRSPPAVKATVGLEILPSNN